MIKQRHLALMAYRVCEKGGVFFFNLVVLKMTICQTSNSKRIRQAIIRKFIKQNVHSSFIGHIWDADLTYTQLISKYHKGI